MCNILKLILDEIERERAREKGREGEVKWGRSQIKRVSKWKFVVFCCFVVIDTMKLYNTTKAHKPNSFHKQRKQAWHTIHYFIHRHRHHDHYRNKHFERHHNPTSKMKCQQTNHNQTRIINHFTHNA